MKCSSATTPISEPKGYEEVFREVLERYHTDFRAEGRHSYDYKLASGRIDRNRR